MGGLYAMPNSVSSRSAQISLVDSLGCPNYTVAMNWTLVIADIRKRGFTLEQIKNQCGFSSRGHVHDLANGKQANVLWEIGDRLLKMRDSKVRVRRVRA